MPELPETETMASQIRAQAIGARLGAPQVWHQKPLGGQSLKEISERTKGQRIVGAERRAKVVGIELELGDWIVMHPKMTGAVLLTEDGTKPKYAIIGWPLDDGRWLWYADMRRFGTVKILSQDEWKARKATFGPEPLDRQFKSEELRERFKGVKKTIKAALMDPVLLAGVGNIYAAEVLWSCGLYPGRAAGDLGKEEIKKLWRELRRILRAAIKAGGTSKRDYIDVFGQKGSYALQLKVYGREGQACKRCARDLVASQKFDARTTVWCPNCQAGGTAKGAKRPKRAGAKGASKA